MSAARLGRHVAFFATIEFYIKDYTGNITGTKNYVTKQEIKRQKRQRNKYNPSAITTGSPGSMLAVRIDFNKTMQESLRNMF